MARALLVHGLQSSAAGWWRVEGWLRDAGWDVDTRNLLGHGGRGAASDYSFAAYADDLDDDNESWDLVVGHSLGGAVATTVAARRPEWAGRLILLDPAIVVAVYSLDKLAREFELEQLTSADALTAENPDWHPNEVAAKLFALSGVDTNAARGTFIANRPWDVTTLVERLTMPTLLLTGDPQVESVVSRDLAGRVTAANPRVTYRVIEGGDHSPHRNRPDATRDALLDWLDRVSDGLG